MANATLTLERGNLSLRPRNLTLDLSSWMRGPYSGVGRAAVLAGLAVRKLHESDENHTSKVRFVQRSVAHSEKCLFHGEEFRVEPMMPVERFFGRRGDIYHSFEHRMPRMIRSRKVITLHDCWTLHQNFWQSGQFQKRQRPLLIQALKRADRIVVPSQATLDELRRTSPEFFAKARLVHLGPTLLPSEFEIDRQEKISPFTEQGGKQTFLDEFLAKKLPFLLVVANFENRKNFKTIFNAFQRVRGLPLVVAGQVGFGGEEIQKKIDLLKEQGKAIYSFKKLDEAGLKKLFMGCRAFLSASYEEGFGLPVLEAMSFGKPVILSRIPAHEELAGDAALYFEPDLGLNELVEFWETVRDDNYLQSELSKRSLERAKKYSWQRCAKELVEVYDSLR